jgi:predicted DCC family thiol-disulfide oxidoreductase YuxK
VAIQSPKGEQLLAGMTEDERLASWHLVLPSGEVRSGGAAAEPLARLLPCGRPLAAAFATFPSATDRAYRWVADHRSALARLVRADRDRPLRRGGAHS